MTLDQFANDVATLRRYGFQFGTRSDFDRWSPAASRAGIAGEPGAWGIWDSGDDSTGWSLIGDDPAAIARETVESLELDGRA